MNWNMAKNLTIIFLLVLNVFLGVMVNMMSEKKSLTVAEEQATYKYLSQNKVNLYNIMLKEYQPMRQMRLYPVELDKNRLKDLIFPDRRDVKVSLEQNKTIYQLEDEKLSISENTMSYEHSLLASDTTLTKQRAIQICDNFMENSGRLFSGFTLDRIYPISSESNNVVTVQSNERGVYEYIVEYRTSYKQVVIHDSLLQFKVVSGGISAIECISYQLRSFEGSEKEIISPDEAVYAFIQNLNYLYGEQETLVDSMDIVYSIPTIQTDTVWQISAPHYRFYIFGNEYPILINAYTGESVYDFLF